MYFFGIDFELFKPFLVKIYLKKILSIFLKDTTSSIDNIFRDKSFFSQGLSEVIAESNKRIQTIKEEIRKIKVKPSHSLHEYISKIIEILEDDINQRIKVYRLFFSLIKKYNISLSDK